MRAPGIALLLPVLLATLAMACGGPPPPRRNIVLVTFDTTRADRIGAYGHAGARTPALDALADRGVLFHQAQSQSAVTPVAHASLFTGLNPYRHQLRTLHGNRLYRLPDQVETLAEVLTSAGYATAAVTAAFPCSRRFGLHQGFGHYDDDFADRARVGTAGNVSTGLAQRDAAAVTNAALAWLEGRRGETTPWFLWVHYFDPHDPLLRPPPAVMAPFMEGFEEHGAMDALMRRDLAAFIETYAGREELMRPWLSRLYDAEIHWTDLQMSRLLDEVAALDPGGDTIVAVTADHGEGLGDHGWWGHGILYQEQIRVPLVLAGGGLPEGVEVSSRVRHVDLAPTLAELAAGLGFAEEVDGASLLPLITAAAQDLTAQAPGVAYADSVTLMSYGAIFARGAVEEKDDQLYTIIDGNMKWIRHRLRPAESELYDLGMDPGEMSNLIKTLPAEARRLDALLETLAPMTESLDFSLPDDPEVLKRLRSLGYVGPGGS